jgi:phosphatidate cytidylyltransferase
VSQSSPVRVDRGPRAGLARRILSTMILLPALVWLVAYAGGWAFTALTVLVAGLGLWEFVRLFDRAGLAMFPIVTLVGGMAVTASFAVTDLTPVALTLVLLGALAAGLRRPVGRAPAWEPVAITMLGVCYVGWLLGHAIWLRAHAAGVDWILLLLWVTWIGETMAYLIGSTMGRRKLAAVVSPKKTVEGAVAQLVSSPVAALAVGYWLMPWMSGREAVGVGLLLGVAGQVGDLVESLLKRSVGTKDTGDIIPGHGGILDRVDGLLFNTPVLFYYVSHGRVLAS